MIVYRLSKSEYSHSLNGRGAELSGGRWNSKGVQVVYTAQNISLCMAEVAVHMPLGIVPKDYELITIEIPDKLIESFTELGLTNDWRQVLSFNDTQKLGDDFFKSVRNLVLEVPSAVVEGEFNYLINPLHSKINKVKILNVKAFGFDERLFVR